MLSLSNFNTGSANLDLFNFLGVGFLISCSNNFGSLEVCFFGGLYFFISFGIFVSWLGLSFIVPSNDPTFTVSPSFTAMLPKIPFEGAGTSTLTLSVSNSTIGSSATTLSPWDLSHLETVASVTDSPSVGTVIFSDI